MWRLPITKYYQFEFFQIALPALYSLTLPVITHFTLGFVFGPGSDNSDFRRRLDATLTATWAYW